MSKCCGICKHFDKNGDMCRRYPPAAGALFMGFQQSIGGQTPITPQFVAWPKVDSLMDYCGEFNPEAQPIITNN